MALLVYLAFMAYLGYPHLRAGETLFYFGVIAGSLVIILLLYLALRRRDRIRAERDEKLKSTYSYGTYKPEVEEEAGEESPENESEKEN